jgi:flavodoxin
MTSILLIYATGGGNTEIASEKVAEVLTAKGHEVQLQRAECSTPEQLGDYSLVILASPTYGKGVLEPHMTVFTNQLRKNNSIKSKKCAVIGLGDGKYYPYYLIEAATVLEDFVKEMEGELVVESLRINKSPVPQLEGGITKWAEQLAETA